MSTTIAISGKGGSGKTTLAAMIVRRLVEQTGRTVLAVDADPNSCLGLALGVEPETTVAEIREAVLNRELAGAGANREVAFEYALHRAVAEAKGFDLLAMGLPEGPKCYCAVNHLVRKYLDAAAGNYHYIVLDNEAGMEHLSRRTTDAVEFLIIVAEATALGATTAQRILGLSQRLPIAVRRRGVLWNKVRDPALVRKLEQDLPTVGIVPYDEAVMDGSTRGATVFDLPHDAPAVTAVDDALAGILDLEEAKQRT